jgi:hypothetical protein
VKGSVKATNTAQCSCKQEQRRGKVECMSGGMVDIYYLLALSRRPRPGWPLEERVGRREVEVGATSSCLGVRSRYFARPGHGALRRCFYLLATSTLSNDSSSHLPCRSTTLVLVSRLRTAPPPSTAVIVLLVGRGHVSAIQRSSLCIIAVTIPVPRSSPSLHESSASSFPEPPPVPHVTPERLTPSLPLTLPPPVSRRLPSPNPANQAPTTSTAPVNPKHNVRGASTVARFALGNQALLDY